MDERFILTDRRLTALLVSQDIRRAFCFTCTLQNVTKPSKIAQEAIEHPQTYFTITQKLEGF